LHALVGSDGTVPAWRVAPMNKDERVMAQRLLRTAPPEVGGYVVGDGNFDSNPLHQVGDERGELQLLAPRRYGPGRGTGHKKPTAGRLRCIQILESPFAAMGERRLQDRATIERQFGNLTNGGAGLSNLPAWVRTHRRVRRWVQAKMILTALKGDLEIRTYVA
jgi:hypothetical protein